MIKILKKLNVIQEKIEGKRYRRINPWNPLSYITIVLTFVVGIVCFGVIGFWKELDIENPFKWK